MTPESGRWVKTASGWVDQNTGFVSQVDPTFAPPGINLPQLGNQQDYQRWEAERAGTPYSKSLMTNPTVSLNNMIQLGQIPEGTQLNTASPAVTPVSSTVPLSSLGGVGGQSDYWSSPGIVSSYRPTADDTARAESAMERIRSGLASDPRMQRVRAWRDANPNAGGDFGDPYAGMPPELKADLDAVMQEYSRDYFGGDGRNGGVNTGAFSDIAGRVLGGFGGGSGTANWGTPRGTPFLPGSPGQTGTPALTTGGPQSLYFSPDSPTPYSPTLGSPSVPVLPTPGSPTDYSSAGFANNQPILLRDPRTGQSQTLSDTESVVQAISSGWTPIDGSGQPFEMMPYKGGWMAATDQGWVPLNVLMGNDWTPEQRTAFQQGMQAGDFPQINAQNSQRTPLSQLNIPYTNQGFGSLLQPFDLPFTGESVFQSRPFTEPFKFTYDDFLESPAYKHRLEQGQKLLERSAAAGLRLNTPRTLKELTRFGEGEASQEFDTQYGRKLNEYLTKYGIHQTNEGARERDYAKGRDEYGMLHDIFKGNQTDVFNRLSTLSGTGQTTASQIGNRNVQTGFNLADLLTSGGAARAGGVIGSANARAGGLSGVTGTLQDLVLLRSL